MKQDIEEKDGKTTVTTKHEDGRQDVEIKVNRLDLKDPTPEDLIAEEKIIDAMSKKIVRVVVIHKPTNESVNFDSPLPLVRKRAEEVVRVYNKRLADKLGVQGAEAPRSEFVVVEFEAGQIRVSSI